MVKSLNDKNKDRQLENNSKFSSNDYFYNKTDSKEIKSTTGNK